MRRKLLVFVFLLATSFAALTAWLMGRPLGYESGAAPVGSVSASVVAVDAGRAFAGSEPDAGFPSAVTRATPDIGVDAATLPAIPPINTRRARTPSLQNTQNYLLVGLDHTHGNWGRADTLLVAVFDADTGHVGVISIPRDLYVEIPDHGPARINATLRIAARQHRDPLELARRVVSDTLAIPIQHVITGEIEVFERVVDTLGGVTLDVPCPIRDDFIDTRTPTGRRRLELLAGPQRLDGVTAAMYARSRHGRSDWDRARRQQALLFALRHRVSELGPAGYLPLLGDGLSEGVHTDMTRLQMLALARRISRLRPGRIHGLVLGHRSMQSYRTPEGRAVQLPDFDAIDETLGQLFDAPAPGSSGRHARCQEADAALRHHTRGSKAEAQPSP
ncbi:MAG: LCP family protein [Deltaproteobacteria bacterium]|nr:LCP family protein [Deltaproteobacteria bacterium]